MHQLAIGGHAACGSRGGGDADLGGAPDHANTDNDSDSHNSNNSSGPLGHETAAVHARLLARIARAQRELCRRPPISALRCHAVVRPRGGASDGAVAVHLPARSVSPPVDLRVDEAPSVGLLWARGGLTVVLHVGRPPCLYEVLRSCPFRGRSAVRCSCGPSSSGG
jgi:hypothetical protein